MKLAVVSPVFNEGGRAVETIKKIRQTVDWLIVVVDDGSREGEGRALREELKSLQNVLLLCHEINLGKGAAIKTGVEAAFEHGAEAVVLIDSDGQHNVASLPVFARKLAENDIVFGYRVLDGQVPWVRRMGNIWASWLIRWLFGIKKRDLLSGYLAFSKKVYPKIEWQSRRYGIETEMAAKIGREKLPFSEIKIDTIYVDKYKGVTMLDAIKILCQLPFWYFRK